MKKYLLLFLSFPLMAQDWSLVDNMAPAGSEKSDFGISMVFAGEHLVVSWPRTFEGGFAETTPPSSCGEVITYEKVNGEYQPIATLTATDLVGSCVKGDGFGYGLAYDNGRLVIGMPAGVRAGMGRPGGASDADSRVFLTHFENGNWVLDETLVADDLGPGRGMGFQLVLEDDTLLVHAHEYDSIYGFSFVVSTGVYVFEDSGSGFNQTQKLAENFHLFGQDFDYEDGQIVVGAWGQQTLTAPGRVYVYEKSAGSWDLSQTINDTRNSNLGSQIEIDGDLMAIGAVQAGGSGSVTIYKNNGGQWQETQFIQADDAAFNDQFAIAVRIAGDDLLVGATGGTDPGVTSGNAIGAVYHFVKNSNGDFEQQQKIESFEPNEGNDQFGANLVFNGTDLLVSEISGGTLDGASSEFLHYSREGSGIPDPDPIGYNVNSKSSGAWHVADNSDHAINIEVMPNNRVLMYGNTNINGEPLWLVGNGTYQGNTIDFSTVYTTSGGTFGASFNPADVTVTDVGSAMVSFSECGAGEFMFDLTGLGTSTVEIEKATEVPGNECGSQNKILPNGISGSWFDPTRSGEGYSVYMFEEAGQSKAMITWYTYNEAGQQLAFTGVGVVSGQTVTVDVLKSLRGAELFSGTAGVTQMEMGSLSMTWDECRVAQVDYDLSLSNLGTGSMQVQQLNQLANTDCGSLSKNAKGQ